MTTLLDKLLQLISALDENEIEYAVCGGLALTIHGFPRATFDIDVLIRPESLEKAYEIAAEFEHDIRGLDRSFKEPSKFGAFPKLTLMWKFCRFIYCLLLRRSKMFGKREKH